MKISKNEDHLNRKLKPSEDAPNFRKLAKITSSLNSSPLTLLDGTNKFELEHYNNLVNNGHQNILKKKSPVENETKDGVVLNYINLETCLPNEESKTTALSSENVCSVNSSLSIIPVKEERNTEFPNQCLSGDYSKSDSERMSQNSKETQEKLSDKTPLVNYETVNGEKYNIILINAGNGNNILGGLTTSTEVNMNELLSSIVVHHDWNAQSSNVKLENENSQMIMNHLTPTSEEVKEYSEASYSYSEYSENTQSDSQRGDINTIYQDQALWDASNFRDITSADKILEKIVSKDTEQSNTSQEKTKKIPEKISTSIKKYQKLPQTDNTWHEKLKNCNQRFLKLLSGDNKLFEKTNKLVESKTSQQLQGKSILRNNLEADQNNLSKPLKKVRFDMGLVRDQQCQSDSTAETSDALTQTSNSFRFTVKRKANNLKPNSPKSRIRKKATNFKMKLSLKRTQSAQPGLSSNAIGKEKLGMSSQINEEIFTQNYFSKGNACSEDTSCSQTAEDLNNQSQETEEKAKVSTRIQRKLLHQYTLTNSAKPSEDSSITSVEAIIPSNENINSEKNKQKCIFKKTISSHVLKNIVKKNEKTKLKSDIQKLTMLIEELRMKVDELMSDNKIISRDNAHSKEVEYLKFTEDYCETRKLEQGAQTEAMNDLALVKSSLDSLTSSVEKTGYATYCKKGDQMLVKLIKSQQIQRKVISKSETVVRNEGYLEYYSRKNETEKPSNPPYNINVADFQRILQNLSARKTCGETSFKLHTPDMYTKVKNKHKVKDQSTHSIQNTSEIIQELLKNIRKKFYKYMPNKQDIATFYKTFKGLEEKLWKIKLTECYSVIPKVIFPFCRPCESFTSQDMTRKTKYSRKKYSRMRKGIEYSSESNTSSMLSQFHYKVWPHIQRTKYPNGLKHFGPLKKMPEPEPGQLSSDNLKTSYEDFQMMFKIKK